MYKKFEDGQITTLIGEVSENIVIMKPFYYPSRKFENHFLDPVSNQSGSMFISLFDGNLTNASSNKLLTLAVGYHSSSSAAELGTTTGSAIVRQQIYKLYAQTLLGDKNKKFTFEKGLDTQPAELLFLSISRNQIKDGIKKNSSLVSFLSDLNSIHPTSSNANLAYFSDINSKITYSYFAGEAGPMYGMGLGFKVNDTIPAVNLPNTGTIGLVFYDHGTYVFDILKIFDKNGIFSGSTAFGAGKTGFNNDVLNGVANKLANISFTNISRPRITIFSCVMEKEEFNYSSNPSFKNESGEIITNSGSIYLDLKPTTYPTQVVLVDELGHVLATAKLTQPIKKTRDQKIKVNARLIQ